MKLAEYVLYIFGLFILCVFSLNLYFLLLCNWKSFWEERKR